MARALGTHAALVPVCGLALLACAPVAAAQELAERLPDRVPAAYMTFLGADWLERPERVREEMPDEMLAALGLEDGDVVADLGAGSGYHTRRMARLVSPSGRVLAVDIQPEMLEILRDHPEMESLTGIETILGEADDPKLPAGEVDWVLIVDVYHELSDPAAMLERLREALAPGGRVALVEYRVEDGTGDHIKADHRMSVRQVLSEWRPAGFELVELHDFLPSQHLFVFQREDDGEALPVLESHDLLDAMRDGRVEVEASGAGPEAVRLSVRSLRPGPVLLTLPVGTYFSGGGEVSDMVARRDGVIVLGDGAPEEWTVLARYANRARAAPGVSDRLTMESAGEHRAERNVMWFFQGINLHPLVTPFVEQLALWIAAEDAGYSELAGYAAQAPIQPEQAIAIAAAYVESAGLDITRMRIWADRDDFVPALTDPNLRSIFERGAVPAR